ncbi:acyl carrier protein [Actinokineospora inagensis]|uniref:acyl carrier protein n=1 Tax=Actinokineospora inagensis TaxID=103730 RepID=UPI00040BE2A2|nr:acyl carrier protein [Actinokineospora inagensis]
MLNTTQDIRALVAREIGDLLLEAGGDTVTPSGALHELGLNSLMLARLVIALESATGVDPFTGGEASIVDMRTVEDIADAYDRALAAPVA